MAYTNNFIHFLLLYAFVLLHILKCTALVRLTNMHCKSFNPNFTELEYCRIRALNRQVQTLDIKVKLAQTINDAVITLQFKKKSNGYNSFRSEIKFDACDFIKRRNNVIILPLYQMWSKYSNMNHTCPYSHDLIVEKMQMEDNTLRWIPFPAGEYAFFSTWYFNGRRVLQMDLYFSYI